MMVEKYDSEKNTITVQPFERRNTMQLNIATDYAIRIVIYMAKQRRIVSSRELSENLKISQPFIYKIMRKLNHAGILAINTGIHGGYILQKETEQINLFEVMDTMERTMKWNRCLEDDRYCSCFATEACRLRETYLKMQEHFENELKETTIQKIIK